MNDNALKTPPAAVHVIGGGLAGSEAAWQIARAGVPVVWVLDVRRRRLEVHKGPAAGAYRTSTGVGASGEVDLPRLRGVRWKVADLLP